MKKNQSSEQLIEAILEQKGIIDAIGNAVSIQSTELKILYQNQAHKNMAGDHFGEYCYQAYERRDSVCEGCSMAMTFRDGGIHTTERSVPTDRGTIYVEITSSPLRDKTGEIIAGIEVVRDITGQKQAKEEAEKYTKRLSKIYELSMALSGDPVHIFQSIARMIRELLDVRVVCLSEIRGDELYFISVCVDDKVIANAGNCPISVTPCATVQQTKDIRIYDQVSEMFSEASFLKEHKAFSYCGFPSLDNRGEVIAVTCLLDDKPHNFSEKDKELLQIFGQRIGMELERQKNIDEQNQTRKALQDSEKTFRQLAENIQEVFWIGSPDWKSVLYISPAYENIWGRSCESLIANPLSWLDAVHKDDSEKVKTDIEKKSAGDLSNPKFPEYRIVRPDGSIRWILARAFPIMNERGQIYRIAGIAEDITDQKKLEEELLRREKLESVGILAGGIAHDFNNMITVILNKIHISKMNLSSGHKAFEHLESAEKALNKAGTLTQQLLTFSKGGVPVKRIINLTGLIEEAAGFALSGSNVTCEFDIADDLWLVDADEGQIHQVIYNLVANADHAMPDGGVVKVHAENSILEEETGIPLQKGKYLKITVTDTGIGISEEHLQKIFDPYFTTKQKGSGLGLAVSYSIINNHNGFISAESAVGAGTTFTIYIPASDIQVREGKISEERLIRGEGRILLMDDDDFVRNALGEILMEIGYEVDSAKDGLETIYKYEKAFKSSRPFDAVIMDLTIPGGMGGKEAIKRLREVDPDVKAIVASGYSDNMVLANYAEYGFRDVLLKPCHPVKLSKVLQDVLKSNGK